MQGFRLFDDGQNTAMRVSTFLRMKSAIWIVMILLGMAVMIGHQSLAPIDRDEARFSQASKQMVASKDFITIRFQDEYRAKKPAGIYWLQASSAALFGTDDIANYRLPSLAGYLASFALMIVFARLLNLRGWGGIAPLMAGLLLASNFIIFAEAHLAKTDSVLLAVILWQQMALFDIYRRRTEGQAGAAVTQFWIAFALSILIKGPIGPLVASTTLALLCAFDRRVSVLAHMRFLRGILITALIVAPWAVSVQIATQGAFLDIAIKGDFLAKVQSAQESHGAPFGTYFLLLPLLAFPASLFAGQLAMIGKALFARDTGRFLIAWIIGYWLVIEVVPTKLPHYILPVLPALWLLILLAWQYPAPARKWRIGASYVIMALAALSGAGLALVLGVLALRYGGVASGAAFFSSLLVVILTGVLLAGFWRWLKAPQSALMAGILALGVLIHMVIIAGVISNAHRIHPSTALAQAISSLNHRPSLIAAAGYHEPSMVFLLGRDVLLVEETEAALLLAEADDGLAIIEARKKQKFHEIAAKLSLDVTEVARIDGFNISKGQDITLSLYRRAKK